MLQRLDRMIDPRFDVICTFAKCSMESDSHIDSIAVILDSIIAGQRTRLSVCGCQCSDSYDHKEAGESPPVAHAGSLHRGPVALDAQSCSGLRELC